MSDQALLSARLEKEYQNEMGRRATAHRQNVSRLNSAEASARNLDVAVRNRPLVLLAQGDSWFDYPIKGNGPLLGDTDIIANLRRMGSVPPTILNLAFSGATAVELMSLSRQTTLIEQLQNQGNWPRGKPDAILFSAGGNDIAGEEFCIFLDFNDGKSDGLNMDRFSRALAMVEACYLSLFAIRDRISPGTPIFSHCYDIPIPNGSHPFCAGPWLKPSLDYCNWSVSDGARIVREALGAFRNMLMSLEEDDRNNFHLIQTQGTLASNEWANELHPFEEGFQRLAALFGDALRRHFLERPAVF